MIEDSRVSEETFMEDALNLLRLQKHDMLNYLQIVHGYLQLNKNSEAKERLKSIITELQLKSSILKIVHPKVVIVMLSCVEEFFKLGIPVVTRCIGNLHSIPKENERILIVLLDKTWNTLLSIFSEENIFHGQIECLIDEDDSFKFVGIDFSRYLQESKIAPLNQLAKKIGYKITFSSENLIISKI